MRNDLEQMLRAGRGRQGPRRGPVSHRRSIMAARRKTPGETIRQQQEGSGRRYLRRCAGPLCAPFIDAQFRDQRATSRTRQRAAGVNSIACVTTAPPPALHDRHEFHKDGARRLAASSNPLRRAEASPPWPPTFLPFFIETATGGRRREERRRGGKKRQMEDDNNILAGDLNDCASPFFGRLKFNRSRQMSMEMDQLLRPGRDACPDVETLLEYLPSRLGASITSRSSGNSLQ